MATNFPGSLDSFTNPSASDAMDSVTVPHADQHANLNDAMEAVQAKLGVGSGTIGEWTSYTPTLTNMTASAIDAQYARVNEFVALRCVITISTLTGLPSISLPVTPAVAPALGAGTCGFLDAGSQWYLGWLDLNLTNLNFWSIQVGGTYPFLSVTSSTVPFTWGAGDQIFAQTFYKAA